MHDHIDSEDYSKMRSTVDSLYLCYNYQCQEKYKSRKKILENWSIWKQKFYKVIDKVPADKQDVKKYYRKSIELVDYWVNCAFSYKTYTLADIESTVYNRWEEFYELRLYDEKYCGCDQDIYFSYDAVFCLMTGIDINSSIGDDPWIY